MRRFQLQRASTHVVVIVCLAVVLLGTLGVVFYKNFIAKNQSLASNQDTAKNTGSSSANKESTSTNLPSSSIDDGDSVDMLRYTNNTYGFRFDFPKQTYGSIGCHAMNQWYDNYGNLTDAPVTLYVVDSGVADMTVLESTHEFTIAQKRAPLFTQSTYGTNQRQYFSACQMVDVTQDKVKTSSTGTYLSTEYRSWQVYHVGSQDEIATLAAKFDSLPSGSNVKKTSYTLGQLAGGRQLVTYSFEYNNTDEIDGGATTTWYYPDKKLLVHIGLGQALSFAKSSGSDEYYIGQIVSSFVLTK